MQLKSLIGESTHSGVVYKDQLSFVFHHSSDSFILNKSDLPKGIIKCCTLLCLDLFLSPVHLFQGSFSLYGCTPLGRFFLKFCVALVLSYFYLCCKIWVCVGSVCFSHSHESQQYTGQLGKRSSVSLQQSSLYPFSLKMAMKQTPTQRMILILPLILQFTTTHFQSDNWPSQSLKKQQIKVCASRWQTPSTRSSNFKINLLNFYNFWVPSILHFLHCSSDLALASLDFREDFQQSGKLLQCSQFPKDD